MHLPPQLIEKVTRFLGDDAREWLPRLPDIVARCRRRWGLAEGVVCPHPGMSYIELTTTADGEAVALKVGVPHDELFTEMDALHLYAGKHAARLFDADRELGAILMQHVQPGTMLHETGDNREQARIAASVMRDLTVPAPSRHGFPLFTRWVERAFRLTRTEWDPDERMPRDLIDKAEAALAAILRGGGPAVVLHGDLHHENILLDNSDGWIAIDPKGAIGPHCLEVGRFLHNQLPGGLTVPRREHLLRERVDTFAAVLGYSSELIAAAGLVDCVLSHCWGFEDEGDIDDSWYDGVVTARLLGGLARDYSSSS